MAGFDSDWVPEIGEIVWLPKYSFNWTDIEDEILGHYVLVLHVTPGPCSKKRYVWFLLLGSTKPDTREKNTKVFFQYKHRRDNGTCVDDHNPTKCGPDCEEFIFLKPQDGVVPAMNMPGYVSVDGSYDQPLEVLRSIGKKQWLLRECSFSMIKHKARDQIAYRVDRWKPRYGSHILAPKISQDDARISGIVCWLQPTSFTNQWLKGFQYPGYGPCVVRENDSGRVTVSLLLNKRMRNTSSHGSTRREAEAEIIISPISSSSNSSCLITGTSTHSIVAKPTFVVSTDDLYELPKCCLPLCAQSEHGSRFGVSNYSKQLSKLVEGGASQDGPTKSDVSCAKVVPAVEVSATVENPNAEGKVTRYLDRQEQEKEDQRKRKEQGKQQGKQQCKQEPGKQEHQALLEKCDVALREIKHKILTASGKLLEQYSGPRTEQIARTVEWLEHYLLLCAATARLRTEGLVSQPNDNEVSSIDQAQRARLITAVEEVIKESQIHSPQARTRRRLRKELGSVAEQCNPFIYLVRLSPWPSWDDFIPKEIEHQHGHEPPRLTQGDSISDSNRCATAPEETPNEKLESLEKGSKPRLNVKLPCKSCSVQ